MNNIIFLVLSALVGLAIGYGLRIKLLKSKGEDFLTKGEKVLKESEQKASGILNEAKKKAQNIQDDLHKDEREKRQELNKLEDRLLKKEEELEKKIESSEKRKEDLDKKLVEVQSYKSELQKIASKQDEELEKVAALSKSEAKEILFKKVEEDYQEELVAHLKKIEVHAKEESKDKAKMIVALAMQKYAAETAAENTATIVQLPSDEMKGRIIGREGRNITAFEHATGVDVIVDETPETVIISGFDLLRRYIAKVSLERLLVDGRIHPARIEEVVGKVKEEVNDLIRDLGEKAVFETGVVGLPSEVVKLLGRLKFRTSHGQNVLKHSIEVCHLAAAMAAELGADVSLCKKAALIHDIGKAVDHEVVGHHAQIGTDICKKFGLPESIWSILESHHGDPEPKSLEAIVVYVANLISNNRPGLDQNNLENYIKRMTDLENIASSFDGVDKAFAVHTGTEVRVIVNSDKVDDLSALKLSNQIAKKIEADVQFLNQIKVDVIREKRVEAYAE
jgi:ribonuclease Y